MDTNDAIGYLESLQGKLTSDNITFQASIDQNNNLITAVQTALDQLKGILVTQLAVAKSDAQIKL